MRSLPVSATYMVPFSSMTTDAGAESCKSAAAAADAGTAGMSTASIDTPASNSGITDNARNTA